MGIYTIKVKHHFAAAHALRGYQGDCARLHGHNWYVEVEITSTEVNDIGICFDFKDIKKLLKKIIDQKLDHRYLNEIPPFDKINPTAENVVVWIYNEFKTELSKIEINCKLQAVTLWETEKASVRYADD